MKKETEDKILKLLETTMLTLFHPQDFRIGGHREENICLNRTEAGNYWIISLYEKGYDNPISIHDNILDACCAFINIMTDEEEAAMLKELFLESAIEENNNRPKKIPIPVTTKQNRATKNKPQDKIIPIKRFL